MSTVEYLKQVNWKRVGTAIASALALLSVAPYSLGEFAEVIPPHWKAKLLFASMAAAFLLRVWNSKPKPPPQ